MTAISVDRIVPLTHIAMRVTPEHVADLFGLIQAAKEAKAWKGEPTPVDCADGTVGWQIIFRYEDGRPEVTAHPGYWVVADSELNVEVLTPPEGTARFHANVNFSWDALTTAPEATLNTDGSLHLKFREPKSINGPWSYVVVRTDVATSETVEFSPGSVTVAPVQDSTFRVIAADVSLDIVPGLVTGHSYTFSIVATATSYSTTATSAPSAPVTLAQ